MSDFPPCPASLKQIMHFLKAAQQHDARDPIISYWCRLYALQLGLKLSTQQPEETRLLLSVMDWLEKTKSSQSDNESITNDVAAQAYIENYALKLFMFADKQDRECNFGKNVVKAFYTSGLMYDVLQTFGELTDEATQNRKYAKWKAAYIHNCLQNGITPSPGPMEEGEEGEGGEFDENEAGGPTTPASAGSDDLRPVDLPARPATPTNLTPGVDAAEVLRDPNKLPMPPADEEKSPGGFVPFEPAKAVNNPYVVEPQQAAAFIPPDLSVKAQKYCKLAGSAINFDDVSTAVDYLQKALRILTTGEE